MTSDYMELLKEYSEHLSLDQMRVVCHISKKTARRLLHSGLVPCENTGKKTHTYLIQKSDILTYLIERDKTPEKYGYKTGSYELAYEKSLADTELKVDVEPSEASIDKDSCYVDTNIDMYSPYRAYPDVLTVKEAAALAGVAASAVNDWVNKKYLISFKKNCTRYIPKISLIEYLQSHRHEFNSTWKKRQFSK